MAEVTLSAQNRIVLPKEACEALDLKPGDKLLFVAHADRMIIVTKKRTRERGAVSRSRNESKSKQTSETVCK
jgi:AbrB family looped-hinge helix DNA binding protein